MPGNSPERARGAPQDREADRLARRLATEYEEAIRAFDGAAAERCAHSGLDAGLSTTTVYARVIAPAMWRVGELWERCQMTVAEEHAATAVTHRVMASVYSRMTPRKRVGARVMLAAIEGQQHALGLRMVADVLEEAGYDVIYLSADVPTESLIGAVAAYRPHLVGLSLTLPPGTPILLEAIAEVRAIAPEMPVVVGGRGVPKDLAEREPVLVAELESAVRVVGDLVGSPPAEIEITAPVSVRGPVPAGRDADLQSTGDPALDATVEVAELMRSKAREAQRYRRMALIDPVTELPNRRAFDDRFEELIAADGASGALLMIDLDHFKRVNDDRGHEAGDRTLAAAARGLRSALREADFVARFGGDEFVLLLPGVDRDGALITAERVRASVERALRPHGVTCSVGVAMFGEGRRTTVLAADQALYAAKRAGRNRVDIAAEPPRRGAAA